MQRFILGLWLVLGIGFADSAYELTVLVDGVPVVWQLADGMSIDGFVHEEEARTRVHFEGGWLELNLSDWGTFAFAHITEVAFRPTGEASYTVTATVRSHDTGWDAYADAFEVIGSGVGNGLRVLLHPHEDEQPFTRSQFGVTARAEVWVEARMNTVGAGGSVIGVDLRHPAFAESDFRIAFVLEPID